MFSIVGFCPICGAPMHSPLVWHGITPPPVTRTCGCFPGPKYEYATSTTSKSTKSVNRDTTLDNEKTSSSKKVLVPYDEHEKNIKELRELRDGAQLEPSGIACPKCGEELYIKANIALYVYPPKKEAVCTKCGHLCHVSSL